MKRYSHAPALAGGFVLVATLWVLAALTVFVGFIATEIEAIQGQALQLKDHTQQRLDRRATEATILYLAATRPMSYAGLTTDKFEPIDAESNLFDTDFFKVRGGELRLDNRPYRAIGSAFFSLQDASSLISLRGNNFARLKKLLSYLGLHRSRIETLVARLQDYTDRDQLLRLSGAEYQEYRQIGWIPPTDRFLVSPMQLLNIVGWKDSITDDQFRRLLSEVTIYVANRENFNFMTEAGMRTLGEIDDDVVQRLIAERETVVFRTLFEVNRAAGSIIPSDPLQMANIPSNYLRMTLWNHTGRQKQWIGITLTPGSMLAPWEIDYRMSVDHVDNGIPRKGSNDTNNATMAATNPPSILFRSPL